MSQLQHGPLLAACVAAMIATTGAAQADPAAGERAFKTRCAGCHSLEAGANAAGPHLAKVLGRKAGSVPGARYSRALQNSGVVWDARTLDAFLANPRQTVPGTTMLVNVPGAADRTALIAFLGASRRTGTP